MGRITDFFARHGIYWNRSFQRLELSRRWAILVGFCTGILMLAYISSFFG